MEKTASRIFQNQIFHCTRCVMPKRVTSWRGHLDVFAPEQPSFSRRNVSAVASRWQLSVRLTGPRFEPQTFRSRDERATVRSTSGF